jgi:putative transposase
MKKSRFTEEQIIKMLKQVDAGAQVDEVTRPLGISRATYYYWRKKFDGLEVNEARRLRDLEAENSRLKRLVADQALDIFGLRELVTKKW